MAREKIIANNPDGGWSLTQAAVKIGAIAVIQQAPPNGGCSRLEMRVTIGLASIASPKWLVQFWVCSQQQTALATLEICFNLILASCFCGYGLPNGKP
jgi:hypothetical protein